MNKQEFIDALRERISTLPRIDVNEQIEFYTEMIDERVADGMSEEEAVAEVGSIELIRDQIIENIPFYAIISKKIRQNVKKANKQAVILISTAIVWFPILLALVISAAAVVISLYVTLWALVVSVWAVFVSLAAAAPFGLLMGILNIFSGNTLVGLSVIGAAITLAGLAIFSFFGALYATKGTLLLTKSSWNLVKKLFTR